MNSNRIRYEVGNSKYGNQSKGMKRTEENFHEIETEQESKAKIRKYAKEVRQGQKIFIIRHFYEKLTNKIGKLIAASARYSILNIHF